MPGNAGNISIAIVIPSYNSQKTIADCLNALNQQTYSGSFQVFVVDSSEDSTPVIIKNQFTSVQLIHLNSKTDPGTARNLGVKEAGADIILFIDSDCIAPSNWIELMVQIHRENPECIAVGGAVENGNIADNNVAWASYMAEFRENIPQQPAGSIWHNPTCNISYKRKAFEKYGYFDSRLYPQEDLVFNYNLSQSGEIILFEPRIAVRHFHRENIDAFLVHQKRLGTITAQVLKLIDLPGSRIARNKAFFLLIGAGLPLVKYYKTLEVFWKLNRVIIKKHPGASFILLLGIIYWYLGFAVGVFRKPLQVEG